MLSTPQFYIPEGMIDLSIGQPAMELLPFKLIKQGLSRRYLNPKLGLPGILPWCHEYCVTR